MNEPLAILLCSRGLIATQLADRLEALRYRKTVLADPGQLTNQAERDKAMVVLADLEAGEAAVVRAVQQLRAAATTAHIPVIAFRRELDEAAQLAFADRGLNFVVNEHAILNHLPQLLDRALEVH